MSAKDQETLTEEKKNVSGAHPERNVCEHTRREVHKQVGSFQIWVFFWRKSLSDDGEVASKVQVQIQYEEGSLKSFLFFEQRYKFRGLGDIVLGSRLNILLNQFLDILEPLTFFFFSFEILGVFSRHGISRVRLSNSE